MLTSTFIANVIKRANKKNVGMETSFAVVKLREAVGNTNHHFQLHRHKNFKINDAAVLFHDMNNKKETILKQCTTSYSAEIAFTLSGSFYRFPSSALPCRYANQRSRAGKGGYSANWIRILMDNCRMRVHLPERFQYLTITVCSGMKLYFF